MRPTLSFLIVAWNNGEALAPTLSAVLAEMRGGDELIVVDNDSRDGTAAVVERHAPAARLIRNRRNVGFAAACNEAAGRAGGDLLVMINPDAVPLEGFGAAIRRPWEDDRGWDAWQPLITGGRGAWISSAGNPAHFTGIAWAGLHGLPISEAPGPVEVPTFSGACFAIRREAWARLGGFSAPFFLYQEDVDLSLRMRLAGGRIGIEPAARVDHDYDFGSREVKWRWLERNRWSVLIRDYPTRLLLLLLPSLAATEVAVLAYAASDGWAGQKLWAIVDVARRLPRLLRERRRIQAARAVSVAAFAEQLTADLDSPFFPELARAPALRWGMRAYWRLARRLLGAS